MTDYIVDIILNPFDYDIDHIQNAMDIMVCYYDSHDELAQVLFNILNRLKMRDEK